MGVLAKNVFEHVGGIVTVNPELIYKNISILRDYNISLNSENGNGYTLLGMSDLSSRLDYLIENDLLNTNDGLTEYNVDLIRNISIKDNYKSFIGLQNSYYNDRIDDASQKMRRIA